MNPFMPSRVAGFRRILRAASTCALLGCCAVTGLLAAAPATQPALPALTPSDQAMLQRLETGTWRQRQTAQEEISRQLADNPPIVQAMLAATKDPDAIARLRAIAIHVAEERDVGTSLITLHMKDAPAKTVYTELFRQASATIDAEPKNLLDEPALPKLSIDVDHQPFWTVEQQLAKSSGIGLGSVFGGGSMLRRGASIESGPQVISGPVLGVLNSGDMVFGGMRIRHSGQVPHMLLLLYPEPKIRIVMNTRFSIEHAIDNNGNELALSADRPLFLTSSRHGDVALSFPLQPAAHNPGDRLTRFRCMLSLQVAVRPQRVEIDDLTHAAARDFHLGKTAIRFEGCKQQNNWWQVTFSATGVDAASQLQQLMQQPIAGLQALDATGNRLMQAGISFSNSGDAASISFLFGQPAIGANGAANSPAPDRLICVMPSDLKVLDLPMDFKNIDIPISHPQ